MCCFAQPVVEVTDTNLFARMKDSQTQLLAYQMKFSSKTPNAMILPLPVNTSASEDSVRFISLKGYDNFFEDLNNGFPQPPPPARSRGKLREDLAVDSQLIVHEVGDFAASFVPSIKDFSRLDPQFVIPKKSWDKIPLYADYGFAVFQLKKLRGTTHPMAFEFKTRLKDQIFFPTVHIHDGEVHQRELFDHTLYLQNASLDEKAGRYLSPRAIDRKTGFVRSQKKAAAFCDIQKSAGLVKADQLVHRIQMRGRYRNTDVIASLNRGPFRFSRASIAPSWSLTPLAAGLTGLAWLFGRREKLQKGE